MVIVQVPLSFTLAFLASDIQLSFPPMIPEWPSRILPRGAWVALDVPSGPLGCLAVIPTASNSPNNEESRVQFWLSHPCHSETSSKLRMISACWRS